MDRQQAADIWFRVSSSDSLFRSGTVSQLRIPASAALGLAPPSLPQTGRAWVSTVGEAYRRGGAGTGGAARIVCGHLQAHG